MTLIKDLITIPEQIQQGDFVLNLSAGIEADAAKRTLDEYVVTPQLAECFENALSFINSAMVDQNNRSKGAYLHGSFGSGKSHFMAVLHLLLQGNTQARAIPDLAASVTKHDDWMSSQKILLVPYHMIGASSVEAGVLGGYAKYIAKQHPDAPVPGFYQSDRLFNDAQSLRESFGDKAFFEKLNSAVSSADDDDGWGELASSWEPSSFESVITASDDSQDRARLVGDLIAAFFSSVQEMTASDGKGFISFDDGLSVLTQHAKDLGYDAVILFLDELILWLASNLSNPDFINREIQKIVKLVESSAPRVLPLVSLIARQRDLREFIGDSVMGVEQSVLSDALKHWEGRFHQIKLADNNLPVIAERRLLGPVSDAAKREIDQAFDDTTKIREETFNILLTKSGDREQFRKLYPFSPAIIEALVALSSALQRERTAIKNMLLLLVRHRKTLKIGSIIPVGDLYDVIADEATPFSDGMRQHFDSAQRLLKTKLIPLLETEYQVEYAKIDQLPVDDTKFIGFQNDLRLMKTLLLSALVPEVDCFQQLTAAKIAALNHGTIKSPIPGRESSTVNGRFGKWAGQVGEIRISDDADTPIISLQLLGVDTQAILDNAASADNPGNRSRLIKEIVANDLGIDVDSGLFQQYQTEWRGSNRTVEVQFLNIREISDQGQFEARDEEWRILIDYPFDQGTHSPSDDNSRINEYVESGGQGRTICWLPAFLGEKQKADLGKLVRLDHVLRNEDSFSQHTTHLSPQDRLSARQLLDSQRSSLKAQIKRLLLAAYGVSESEPDTLQHEGTVEPVRSLEDGFSPNLLIGNSLGKAFQNLLDQALSFQFPAHPKFENPIKSVDITKVEKEIRKAIRAEGGRIEIDQPLRAVMRNLAQPLELGEMHERHFIYSDTWPQRLRQRIASSGEELSVGNLRSCIDGEQATGLHAELQNLLIMVFAENGNYAFNERGSAIGEPSHKSLNDEWVLIKEELAPPEDWRAACDNAGAVFGSTASSLLTGSNQQHLIQSVKEVCAKHREEVVALAQVLAKCCDRVGLDGENAHSVSKRVGNAKLAIELANKLPDLEGVDFIKAVAEIGFISDAQALGASVMQAGNVKQAMEDFNWPLLELAVTQVGAPAVEIRERVVSALKNDQRVQPLEPVLRRASTDCTDLLRENTTPPSPRPEPSQTGTADEPSTVFQQSDRDLTKAGAVNLLAKASKEIEAHKGKKLNVQIHISTSDDSVLGSDQ